MNTADKEDIEELLAEAAQAKKGALKYSDTPYFDRETYDYVHKTMYRASETAEYIRQSLDKNIRLFFDLDDMKLDKESFYRLCNGENLTYTLGDNHGNPLLLVTVKIDKERVRGAFVSGKKADGRFSVDVDGISVKDVRPWYKDWKSLKDCLFTVPKNWGCDLVKARTCKQWTELKDRAIVTATIERDLVKLYKDAIYERTVFFNGQIPLD